MFKGWLCLFICFLGVCQGSPKSSHREEKPVVLVSIAPYAHFVEKIAGDTVQVIALVPSQVNIHTYEPTIREMTKAESANVWFRIGEPFEKRVARVFQQRQPRMEMVELWKGIPLLAGEGCALHSHHLDEESKDLHVWMNPLLVARQCKKIAEGLERLQPNHAEEYAFRLAALERELLALDREIKKNLKPFEGDAILVSHPAFGYFCQEYRLIQLSVECAEKDPLPKDIERILQEAKRHRVRAVFTQEGYSNKGAELIAKRLHLPVFVVDPYAKNYARNLLSITELIADPS